MASAADKLALAQRHLTRVRDAWPEPTDWDDLFLYGFYALEAAVDCACTSKNRLERPTGAESMPPGNWADMGSMTYRICFES